MSYSKIHTKWLCVNFLKTSGWFAIKGVLMIKAK